VRFDDVREFLERRQRGIFAPDIDD